MQDLSNHPVPAITKIELGSLGRALQLKETIALTLLVKVMEFEENAEAGTADPKVFNLQEFDDVVRATLPSGLPPKRRVQITIEVIESTTHLLSITTGCHTQTKSSSQYRWISW